ncbi:YopX family protein [Rhodococcus sp. YH3-3]|uniref:YopX family protein n=1 Tax=Rhodococcus sp. YH3-3 TaxID=1803579 RepID=UPI0007DB2101|nr:YopX family protein [Rhodococcus sp. YH3-3]
MNRVIKFRAWDRRNKKIYPVVSVRWSYGSVLRHFHRGVPEGDWLPDEVVVILGNDKMRTFSYFPHPRSYIRIGSRRVLSRHAGRHIRDLTLLEFTGLMDKNGIEIYDSDIVRLKFREAPDEYSFELGVVKWHESSSAFKWFALEEDLSDGNNYWLTHADCDGREVVGNLYEHPHLLEESS